MIATSCKAALSLSLSLLIAAGLQLNEEPSARAASNGIRSERIVFNSSSDLLLTCHLFADHPTVLPMRKLIVFTKFSVSKFEIHLFNY